MTAALLLIRLESLKFAIVRRDWDDVEFQFDRVLSMAERDAGVRRRAVDELRLQKASER